MQQNFRKILWCLALIMVYGVLFRQLTGENLNEVIAVSVSAAEEAQKAGKVQDEAKPFIVIDSGHGFFDAGKIGVSGAEEKDINLAIALKLRENLRAQGFEVRMTRENDDTLYDGVRPSDKRDDMRKRAALMTDKNCILAVSIHQNSFTEEKYKGAQVFYYRPSERSHRLASAIQGALIEFQDSENTRQEKANEDYYLLRKETVPTVICECGFMSNAGEEALLKSEAYQEKTAWAISIGIIRYLNEEQEAQITE